MKYKIMKNGKRFNTKTYGSYEEARKYAIKKVRSMNTKDTLLSPSRYPMLSEEGFSIKRIDA